MNNHPPKWMMLFFRWYCRKDLVDAVEGDLLEQYQRNSIHKGRLSANLKFLFNVMRFFHPLIIKSRRGGTQLNSIRMFKTNFTFFLRSLSRHRSFTLLNLFGLMLGMAAFIYMIGYVKHERSYDTHHGAADQIYRVTSQIIQDGDPQPGKSSASVALAPLLRSSFPEIESVSRVHILDATRLIVQVKDRLGTASSYTETLGFHAEDGYFDIFSDKVLMGNPTTALKDPNSVVLTESLAKKYFGEESPLGKTISITDKFVMDYLVTAVVADVVPTSHFRYDLLISYNTFEKQRPTWRWTSWDWDYFHTYMVVKSGTDIDALEEKINTSVASVGREVFTSSGYEMRFDLQNIQDIHLESNLLRELSVNGNGQMLYYIEVIAIFVLVLAWVNYINLSTARAALRAKEIGIRKVNGANRPLLISQLLTESFLLNAMAGIGSMGLLLLLSKLMLPLTGFGFNMGLLVSTNFGALILVILVIGSLCAGFYPAIVLSGFEPIKTLKGNFNSSNKGVHLRKLLIVFQLVVSLVLFVGATAVYKQVNHLTNRDLGIDLEQVLVVNMPNVRDTTFWQDYDLFKERVQQHAFAGDVTTTNFVPGNYLNQVQLIKRREQGVQEAKVIKNAWIDFDFTTLFDLDIVAGRNFDKERSAELRNGLLLNESAINVLGFKKPEDVVNKPITWIHPSGEIEEYTAIGVINDFDQDALGTAEPMVYFMNRPQYQWYEVNYISIKLSSDDMYAAISEIGDIFQDVYPTDSFDYFFMDAHFEQRYNGISRFGEVLGIFTLMAIIISNLGLFGLTAFVALQRKKEVSIRKVLGAKLTDILSLFSMQFVLQFLIALAIALPLAYYGLTLWLDKFVHKITLTAGLFILPAAIVILLALITVMYQGLTASRVNPTDNLRNE